MTKQGVPVYVVTIKGVSQVEKAKNVVTSKTKDVREISMPDTYACGCKRGDSKLCKKHGRA